MERELLYQKIYNDLLEGIQEKRFPAGSRLPSEMELAEQYNVSRITSKKALEMLADQNLITRKPGKGSYVLDYSMAEGKRPGEEPAGTVAEEKDCGGRRLIGVVLDSFGAAYGCDVVGGIERECRKQNFHMVLKCTYGNMEEETKAFDELIALGVRGIILMCVQGEHYNENVLKLSLKNFPMVLVDRELAGLPIPCVTTDNFKAAKELVTVLIEKGHKCISFFSHPITGTSTVAARFSGYVESLLEHGLGTSEDMWLRNLSSTLPRLDADDGEEYEDIKRIEAFIRDHPQVTGFFTVDQALGITVYKILCRMGLEKEKEVVFFDGIDESYDPNPMFHHVVQGEYLIGVMAVKYLKDRMEGKDVPKKYCVPYEIVKSSRDTHPDLYAR
ncbi:GntR family transcriptional regulator [Parablautia intestinalis]|jgi:GntR family transcriptional regulator of arabinose operon|uniref:GntR family transcriptional regulator n=1 Tax=Parablautia intestinalis TaxID=2320100 RepID=A0A3A9AT04_9FIRM|nr:GntR family transcriptional regulator [Parablautia intestinalis]MCI8614193.1 GntR family transcriptional regulator [Lachnospiraceae bacterium]RKI89475.1 GntR family transcriptional regulator [Parablautia intestinalis]